MKDGFDAYYTWLSIPPSEQPPHHYRLLGLKTYEANRDVIERAADRQSGHLKTYQTGPRGALSQRLLSEVAAAAACLLDPGKKSAYDQQLAKEIDALPVMQAVSAEPSFPDLKIAVASPVARAKPIPAAQPAKVAKPAKPAPRPILETIKIVGGALLGLFLGVLVVSYSFDIDRLGSSKDARDIEKASTAQHTREDTKSRSKPSPLPQNDRQTGTTESTGNSVAPPNIAGSPSGKGQFQSEAPRESPEGSNAPSMPPASDPQHTEPPQTEAAPRPSQGPGLSNPPLLPPQPPPAAPPAKVEKPTLVVEGHEGKVAAVMFDLKNNRLLTGGNSFFKVPDGRGTNINNPGSDNTVRLWKLDSGSPFGIVNEGLGQRQTWQVQGISQSSDGTKFAVATCRPIADYCMATISVWTINGQTRLHHFPLEGRPGVWTPWFGIGNQRLYAFRGDTSMHIFDLESGKETSVTKLNPEGTERTMQCACMSADRTFIYGGTIGGPVVQWSITGHLVKEFAGHTQPVRSVAVSADSKYLASASDDGTARIWEIATGRQVVVLQHGGHVTTVAFVGADQIVTGGDNKLAVLWKITSAQQQCRFEGHSDEVMCLAVSADHRWLATGSADKTARVWPLITDGTPAVVTDNPTAPAASPPLGTGNSEADEKQRRLAKALEPLENQIANYKERVQDAKDSMLKEFDQAEKVVRNSKTLKSGDQLALLNRLKEEKAAFNDHEYMPFSVQMREAWGPYLHIKKMAKGKLENAFNQQIKGHLNSDDKETATVLQEELNRLLARKIVARWMVDTQWTLWSDWSAYSAPPHERVGTWKMIGNAFTVQWPPYRGKIPVDTCELDYMGNHFDGTNYVGGKFVGEWMAP